MGQDTIRPYWACPFGTNPTGRMTGISSGRTGPGQDILGSIKETNCCPASRVRYHHSRWRPESLLLRQNRRQPDLVVDAVPLRKYLLCFAGSSRRFWNAIWSSPLLHIDASMWLIENLLYLLSFFSNLYQNKHFSIRTVTRPGATTHATWCGDSVNAPDTWPCLHRYLTLACPVLWTSL
jgi:hypothetical protein